MGWNHKALTAWNCVLFTDFVLKCVAFRTNFCHWPISRRICPEQIWNCPLVRLGPLLRVKSPQHPLVDRRQSCVFYSRSIRGAHFPRLGSRCTTKLTILSSRLKLGRRCVELHYGTVLGDKFWPSFPLKFQIETRRSGLPQFNLTKHRLSLTRATSEWLKF